MNRVRALLVKELKAYFNSPTAYVIAVAFLLITGYTFTEPLFIVNQADIRMFVEQVPLLMLFFMPALTMRLFSEEAKTGTIELLMTMPASDGEILAAKFLAAAAVIWATVALTWIYPISVSLLGQIDLGAVYGAYVGLLLTGVLMAGVGVFASSLSRNQVVAFVISFVIGFVLFTLGKLGPFVPWWLAPYADFLGWDSHLASLSRGVLDSRDILYYLTGTAWFLYMARERLRLVRYA